MRKIAFSVVSVLALVACSRQSAGTIVFGAAGPWNEPYGDANRKGIQLAVDEINASPAWAKQRRLEIAFANDSGSAIVAADIARQFVDSAPIVAVVGHVTSDAMLSAARVYHQQLVAVATTATGPGLSGISPWTFRVAPNDSANALTIARFAERLGRTRAAVLYENTAYGRGLTDQFRKAFRGDIVSIDPISQGGDEDLEVFISWYIRSRVNLVFVAGTEASGLAFLEEAKRQGFTADLIGGDGWQTLAPRDLAEGAYIGVPFSAQDPRPEVQAFVEAYRHKYNATPDGNAALAYDATKLLAAAVEKVGPDRGAIREYLSRLTARDAYRGVTGAIRFSDRGDPVDKEIVMARVTHGALVVEPTP